MVPGENPALTAFLAQLGDELPFAQVLIRRIPPGFELRHHADQAIAASQLRRVELAELHSLATYTSQGAYRPLKSAPDLATGWRASLRDESELLLALNQLCPGAIADWHAAQSPAPPVTPFRDFTARQTGMYRITHNLSDSQAAIVVQACCAPRFCLKQRLWPVADLPPDNPSQKSIIPCLEPCALLLEFARKGMRLEQEEKISLELSAGEIQIAAQILEHQLSLPAPDQRQANFDDPANPRRLQLLLQKLIRSFQSHSGVNPPVH